MQFGSTRRCLLYALILVIIIVSVQLSPADQTKNGEDVTVSSVPTLIRTLLENASLSGDIVKRMDAQTRLAASGKRDRQQVVPLLVGELERLVGYDKNTTAQRLALITVLRDMGAAAEAAIPALTLIAEDQDKRNEWASFYAQGALTAIGTPAAENTVNATAQRDLERWLAGATPAEIEKAVREHDFLLRQALRHTRPDKKTIASSLQFFRVVGRQAAAAAPTLRRLFGDERIGSELRRSLGQTLTVMGISDLSATTDTTQLEAKPTDEPLAEILTDVKSEDPLVASMAMSELARLGPSDRVIDVLIGSLRDNHNAGEAARLLGNFGLPAARAVPDLLPYLNDRVAGPNAIQAVGKIGVPDPAVVNALRQITANPGSPLRGQAALALGKLRSQTAVPELLLALNATAKYDRILAAKALAMLGPDAVDAVPALHALLLDPDADIRLASVQSLGQIGAPAASTVADIARLLETSDSRLNVGAEEALEKIGGAAAETLLARHAKRYAKADQMTYQRLMAAGQEEAIGDFMQRLPKARGLQVASAMLMEPNPKLAIMATTFLIQAGYVEEGIPALVDLVARGAVEEKTVKGLGWLHSHENNVPRLQSIHNALMAYLREHIGNYNATEQSRLRHVFGLPPDSRDGVAQ